MNSIAQCHTFHKPLQYIPVAMAFCVALVSGGATPSTDLKLEGFTEPYRTINVAGDETGIIEELLVQEGHQVERGQPLARLNSDVHDALLAIAEQNMQAEGRLDAAVAELQLREDRLAKLKPLLTGGHARQEEVDRATAEVAVSKANVRTAREDLLVRKLEYQKIKVQVGRRTIRASVGGVVTALHKQPGEFVSPNSPDVLTLVQIDSLLANFTVTSPIAAKLNIGQEIKVRFVSGETETNGLVEFIAPTTDAESGMVRVKVRIENSEGRFRSGERCQIEI